MYTGSTLLLKKESVFWLDVLEIPPKVDEPVALSVVQMSFRTRVKIFYRPECLQGKPTDAIEQLKLQLVKGDVGPVLQAHNPAAFHVSLVQLNLLIGGQNYVSEDGMVRPGETKMFPLPTLKIMPNGARAQPHFTLSSEGISLFKTMFLALVPHAALAEEVQFNEVVLPENSQSLDLVVY